MGPKESNQTNKQTNKQAKYVHEVLANRLFKLA